MRSGKKVAFYTLGCKVNQYETESIKKQFLEANYTEVEFEKIADYYIINSCTVTSLADKKTRNILRRAKNLNKDSIVIVTGCYAQTEGEKLSEEIYIDYVIGNSDKNSIIQIIKKIENEKLKSNLIKHNIFENSKYQELEFSTLREMSRAYVKIQDGCDEFCSYCTIPFARGKSRSRGIESILNEVKTLSKDGYKEIILIGINLGVYGKDLKSGKTFEELLKSVSEIDGIERIRLGSVYPDKITDKFIDIIANNPKIMPHLHISLQSCDDEILKKMKRNYGRELIKNKLLLAKNKIDNLGLTADIIVGFPGEKEENFKNSYSLIERIGFSNLHIFKYSDRKNSASRKFPDKVSGIDIKKRVKKLDELRKNMEYSSKLQNRGKRTKVLIETIRDGYANGYTENYKKILIKNNNYKINQIIEIQIDIKKGELYAKEI